MNATGCPEGLASDAAFQLGTVGSCDVNLAGYSVFGGAVVALKFISFVKQMQNWLRRPTHKIRIPRGPLNSLFTALMEAVLFILIGFNIINFHNGLSFSVFFVCFLQFAWSFSVGLLRLVKLGEKILPKSTRGTAGASTIARFDGLGKTLFTFQIVFAFGSSVILIVLSPILVDLEYIISRVGFGCMGMYMACCTAGYIYHFERCIGVIRSVQTKVKAIRITDSSEEHDDFNRVIRKMRINQAVHMFATGPALTIYLLLAFGAFSATIWVMILTLFLDAVGNVCFEFAVKADTSKSKGKASGNNSSKDQVAPAATGDAEGTTAAMAGETQGSSQVRSN